MFFSSRQWSVRIGSEISASCVHTRFLRIFHHFPRVIRYRCACRTELAGFSHLSSSLVSSFSQNVTISSYEGSHFVSSGSVLLRAQTFHSRSKGAIAHHGHREVYKEWQVVRRTNMSYFVPPCNYGMVEHDLSRSGQCHQLNFPFLERHNLKTVIYLSYDEPSQPFLSFLEDQGIDLIRPSPELAELHSQANSMSEAEVLFALQVILSTQYYPLHVMCKFGRLHTGTVIGCLRKLQGWNLTAIFEEYRRYAGSKGGFLNEQFIELFDTDLVRIPVDYPHWL